MSLSYFIRFLCLVATMCTNIGDICAYPKKKNSPKGDVVVERIENISQSPHDDRLYRGLRLSNDLKVLLISDSSTYEAAVSMVVGVGALNDFEDMPGLASLFEILLLTSCKKYRAPNHFIEFLLSHGGHGDLDNSTRGDEQIFSFTVDPEFLVSALHRFLHYLREPLLGDGAEQDLKDAITKLDTFFKNSSKYEINRILEVEKLSAKRDHPFNHFFAGNKNLFDKHSLKTIRKRLREFHDRWYSSNLMTLAVLGKENLDELETIVAPIFANIENKSVERVKFVGKDLPWAEEEYLKQRIYVVPENDIHYLRLNFPTPSIIDQYKTAPEIYVINFIVRSDLTSLGFLLKKEDLCISLGAEYSVLAGIGNFCITCSLTENGLKNIQNIVKLIFQYIFLLNFEGVEEWIFDELKKLRKIHFHNKKKEAPLSYVKTLASDMQNYPIEDVLSHSFILSEWNPTVIKHLLLHINVDNMNITIVSKEFEELADQIEENYETKYGIEKISPDYIERLFDEGEDEEDITSMTISKSLKCDRRDFVSLLPDFKLPLPNKFIPEDFDVYPVEENELKSPYIIHESSKSQIWFKQDDEFRVSRLHVWINIFRPVWHAAPAMLFQMAAYVLILRNAILDLLHPIKMAGYNGNIFWTERGVSIHLHGFPEKLPSLLETIILKITNKLEDYLDEKDFNRSRETHRNMLETEKLKDCEYQSMYRTEYLLKELDYTADNVLASLKWLKYDDMKKFVRTAFSRVFITGFIYGNANKLKAMEIVKVIEGSIRSTRLLSQEVKPFRRVELTYGRHFVQVMFHEKSKPYFSYIVFPVGKRSSAINIIMSVIIFQIMKNSSLDYPFHSNRLPRDVIIPDCCLAEQGSDVVFLISAKSTTHLPRDMDLNVDLFLSYIQKTLQNMSEPLFETYKTSFNMEDQKHLSFDRAAETYWEEITSGFHSFDQFEMEQKLMARVKKKDVLTFYEGIFGETSLKRRRLAIYTFPEDTHPDLVDAVPTNAIRIEDSTSFKSNSYLLPP